MKKKIVSLLLLATMVMSLGGCGTSGEVDTTEGNTATEDSVTDEAENEEVVITALIQQSRYFDGLQAMIAKLEEEENIIIDVQVVPDDEALTMIQMKLNSGTCPDIVDYNVPAIYQIIDPEENFADMSNEEWVDRLLIPENVTADDGNIYGFPFLSVPGIHGFTYNVDVFAEYGIEVPTTWDEFLAVCEELKSNGVTPIYMCKDTWVPQIMMSDNYAKTLGTEAVNEFAEQVATNEVKWTDVPEFAEVIDQYLALYESGYMNDNFTSATYDDAILAVAEGTAAMHFNGDFFAASVQDANPDATISIFNVSMNDLDVMTENMSSAGFVAYKNSENLDTVKKVLNLWSTPEYADLYFEGRSAFPAFEGVNGGETPDYLQAIYDDYISQGKVIPEFNYAVTEWNALFDSTLYVYYVDAPASGNRDGAAIMEQFQIDYEQYMAGQGAEGF